MGVFLASGVILASLFCNRGLAFNIPFFIIKKEKKKKLNGNGCKPIKP